MHFRYSSPVPTNSETIDSWKIDTMEMDDVPQENFVVDTRGKVSGTLDSLRTQVLYVLDANYRLYTPASTGFPPRFDEQVEEINNQLAVLDNMDPSLTHPQDLAAVIESGQANFQTQTRIRIGALRALRDAHLKIVQSDVHVRNVELVPAAEALNAVLARIIKLETSSSALRSIMSDFIQQDITEAIKRNVFLKKATLARRLEQMFGCAFTYTPTQGAQAWAADTNLGVKPQNVSNKTELKTNFTISSIPAESFYDSPPALSQVLQALYTLKRLPLLTKNLSTSVVYTFIVPIIRETEELALSNNSLESLTQIPKCRKIVSSHSSQLSSTLRIEILDVSLFGKTYPRHMEELKEAGVVLPSMENNVLTKGWKIPNILRFAFSQILIVVKHFSKTIFDFMEEELEAGETLSEDISYMFWDNFRPQLLTKIRDELLVSIISHLSNLGSSTTVFDEELQKCIFEIELFVKQLKEINLEVFGVDDDILVKFVENIDSQLDSIKERHIYSIARDILLSDDSSTVLLDQDLADVYGLLAWKGKHLATNTSTKSSMLNKEGLEISGSSVEQEFCIPECYITTQARSLVDLAFNTIEETSKNQMSENKRTPNKNEPGSVLFTARNLIAMYRAIIPQYHSHALETSINRACLYYNDSMYISNNLMVLGNKFKDSYKDTVVANLSTFLDLAADFVAEGQTCLTNILQKSLNEIDNNFKESRTIMDTVSSKLFYSIQTLSKNDLGFKLVDSVHIPTPTEISNLIEQSTKKAVANVKSHVKQSSSVLDSKMSTMFAAYLCKQLYSNINKIVESVLIILYFSEIPADSNLPKEFISVRKQNQNISILEDIVLTPSNTQNMNNDTMEVSNSLDQLTIGSILDKLFEQNRDVESISQWFNASTSNTLEQNFENVTALKQSLRYMLRLVLAGVESVKQTLNRQFQNKSQRLSTEIPTLTAFADFNEIYGDVAKMNKILEAIP